MRLGAATCRRGDASAACSSGRARPRPPRQRPADGRFIECAVIDVCISGESGSVRGGAVTVAGKTALAQPDSRNTCRYGQPVGSRLARRRAAASCRVCTAAPCVWNLAGGCQCCLWWDLSPLRRTGAGVRDTTWPEHGRGSLRASWCRTAVGSTRSAARGGPRVSDKRGERSKRTHDRLRLARFV